MVIRLLPNPNRRSMILLVSDMGTKCFDVRFWL